MNAAGLDPKALELADSSVGNSLAAADSGIREQVGGSLLPVVWVWAVACPL